MLKIRNIRKAKRLAFSTSHGILAFAKSALFTSVLALTTSCSSEETFQAGPSVPESCQQVHFTSSNESMAMLIASDTTRSVQYTLVRNTEKGELTVPINVRSAAAGLNIPASVKFADGDSIATYTITAPREVTEGTTYEFELELAGENVNPYMSGATRFSGGISFPRKRWGRMWFTGMTESIGYFLQDFYDLGNGSLFIPNLMESNTNVWIRYDVNATSTVECDLTTSPQYVEVDESNQGCYYVWAYDETFRDDEQHNFGYTMFYPHGPNAKVYITELCYYVSHDGYNATVYNPTTGSGWIQLSEVQFSDKGSVSNWKFLNWVFTEDPENDGYDYEEPDPTRLPVGTILECNARFNFDDYSLGIFKQTAKVVRKNCVTFEDFMGSGVPVTIAYNGDGELEITCEKGYVQKGVWYLRDEASGEWIDCYPEGPNGAKYNYSITLHNKENLIDYASHSMKFHFHDIYKNGKTNGFDDYLMMSW